MSTNIKNNKRAKGIFIGLSAFSLLGLGVASAANLGIEANNELGAGSSVTASCQPAGAGNDITVGFAEPTYVSGTEAFSVNTVNLGNVDPSCATLPYKVVVSDASGVALAEKTGTVVAGSQAVVLPTAVDSATVGSVSLVIYAN